MVHDHVGTRGVGYDLPGNMVSLLCGICFALQNAVNPLMGTTSSDHGVWLLNRVQWVTLGCELV